MALGGGTFVTQNKILPGSYINFVSKARAMGALGERGTVALMLELDWGLEGKAFQITGEDFQKEALTILGYSYTDPELKYIRETFLGAKRLVCYRPSGNTKAATALGSLKITAKHGGTRGNSIKIIIEADVDDDSLYIVSTLIGDENIEVDNQIVSDINELIENDFVVFKGNGEPEETAALYLEGGTNKPLTGNDYSIFLDCIEAESFTTMLYAGTDQTTKALFISFLKRLRDDEGYKITCILHDYTKADHEGIISVKNTADDENEAALVYWVAGKTAGAQVNESLTDHVYDGKFLIDTRYKNSEFTASICNGEFVFYGEQGAAKVLADINTLVSISVHKNSDFQNNQIIRVLDEIANGTARIFETYYLGKVQNSECGRELFKMELINYHEKLEDLDAITNFSADDITVTKGPKKGDVVVDEEVEPIGSMEKLYMTVTVV